jgi:acetylornithine/succinyldiaminopimelate/putrescine aminotransferase
MPLGAFIAPASVMQSLTHDPVLGHITTFGGHPVCCAAGLAALNVIQDEKLVEGVNAKAELFRELLQHHPKIINIRNAGLLMAIEMHNEEQVNAFIHKGTELGLLGDWFLFNASAFRIAPPLTITSEQIHECCDLVLRCLDEL